MDNNPKLMNELQHHFEQQVDEINDIDFTQSVSNKISRIQNQRRCIFYTLFAALSTCAGIVFWRPILTTVLDYTGSEYNMPLLCITFILMLCGFIIAEE